ncbi:MAG TPA: hypothetical protein VGV38_18915 [Pyrinomonadaceae bacterium]|nr:hypothetical protein [Pyrinomonadaceae bacterium]
MKLKIVVVLIAITLAWLVGRGAIQVNKVVKVHGASAHAEGAQASSPAGVAQEGRDEIRETFKLARGARVEVRGINGPVSLVAVDSDTAEVHVTRVARDRADLERQKVTVEQTAEGLVVRGHKSEDDHWWKFWKGGEVKTEVSLRVPRASEVAAKGVNGAVSIGEFEGAVRVSGVNGRVEIGRSVGTAEVSGVNGGVTLGISRLSSDGVSVKGVNGGVTIRAAGDLNADLEVKGLNGSVTLDVPNAVEQERRRNSLRARIGSGGPSISVKGINGGVRIEPAASSPTSSGS